VDKLLIKKIQAKTGVLEKKKKINGIYHDQKQGNAQIFSYPQKHPQPVDCFFGRRYYNNKLWPLWQFKISAKIRRGNQLERSS
jgi:hypothetical protein